MKIALLMNADSCAGREYANALFQDGIHFEIILIGSYSSAYKPDERCKGLWIPPSLDQLLQHVPHFTFLSLKDNSLLQFLKQSQYDIGIQGGVNIIKNEIIELFNIGILNFHPGNLPDYRGCSCPEWQIIEKKPIICTAHFIDSKIDSGPIFDKKILKLDMTSYSHMRSSIYPEISKFVSKTIKKIITSKSIKCTIQNLKEGCYRRAFTNEELSNLVNKWNH